LSSAPLQDNGMECLHSPKHKLLFLTPVFPLPLYSGQQLRIFNLLQCCTRDFDVTFVAPRPMETVDQTPVTSLCHRVILFDDDAHVTAGWRGALRLRRTFGLLQSSDKLRTLSACAAALRNVRLDDYTLIWLERTTLAPLVRARRSATVLDLDDLEHVKYAQEFRLERSSIRAIKRLPYLARYTYRDIVLSRRFNTVVVCSPEDATYLRRLGVTNVQTVPNGAYLSPVARRPGRAGGVRLVFVGNMAYGPNIDAVKFLAHSIMPRVRKHVADVQIDIIGRPPARLDGLQDHVNFRGFVDDLPGSLADYDLFVAPLRVGSGTKLKLLEAMGIGIPIVTTAIGARGLGLQHRHSALIANTAASFATAILECHNNPDLANGIAANAHLLAKQFRWDDIQRSAAGWLRQLAEEQKSLGSNSCH
jgi:polysaccharide biosynthesis protein PslH